jgi:phosphoribosyl-ATP pyrophosphohydrolase/phosphoribosyl-AMP cyclohydrolase
MSGDATLEVRFGTDGLAPAIVQDARDGRVLMLAWMDAEALTATLDTGDVHFHSRSRDRLWRKGETSGNVLRLRDVTADCDADALLVTVEPVGPTCHRGTRSCFDSLSQTSTPAARRTAAEPSEPGGGDGEDLAFLETLWSTIADRARDRPQGSYTANLLAGGVDAVARKLTEEATEVLIAAKDDAAAESTDGDRSTTRQAVADETADLLYHALVLLAERGLRPADVIDVLRTRSGRATDGAGRSAASSSLL